MSQRAVPALAWRLCASLALVPPLLALAACDARDTPTAPVSGPPSADSAAVQRSPASAASAPARDASAAMSSDFDTRFAELHRTVYTPDTFFSISKMLANLAALEPLLQGELDTPERRFRLYALQASASARGQGRQQEAAGHAQRALAVAQGLAPERFAAERYFLQFSLPIWLSEEDDDKQLTLVEPLLAAYPLNQLAQLPLTQTAQVPTRPSAMQMLGLYEQHGYLLHELGRYQEALAANQRTLATARTLIPRDERHRLQGVLTNIAQNHHALGQLSEAEPFLLERLKLVQARDDDERVLDTYFQLTVLAHERGQAKQADAWLARHEAHTKAMDDEDAIADSKDLRRELLQRRATGR